MQNGRKGRAMKILVYSDGQPASVKALQFAAQLTQSLGADLSVITVRSETHAIEPLPQVGAWTDLADFSQLPSGLQVLAHARNILSEEGLVTGKDKVQIRELPNGHFFICQDMAGRSIPFYVCFGHILETINHEIAQHHYDLLIVAPPNRGRFHKMVLGDITRKLVLDAHTSILFVRQGRANSRFIVCADGSVAAKRQFPMLKMLLPAISPALEFVFVETPDTDETTVQTATHCLEEARKWVTGCDKPVKVHYLKGEKPAKVISSMAGEDAVIVVGASLRHDVYRRLRGSLPIQILSLAAASTLVVKALPEEQPGDLFDPDSCKDAFL
ncbi:MAG: hypothetical protein DSY90_12545 [Deltaproteobacteria bacterium]|nr:MAG: hypothetical protein DSY90_12545 [Deltaproteobacteria bacterium]